MASLVRSAIGFDQARGDVVEIKNMPFSAAARRRRAGVLVDARPSTI